MVDILRQTRLDTEQSRMLSIVQRSAMNLLHILNDILDFSKIEAGMLTTERIPINLRELLEEVTKMMLLACNAKLIELTLFVSPALPLRIMSDPIRLRQVLLNLLSNAVKFTNSHQDQQGTLKLLAEPCVLAQNQAGVKLRVVDTGIGISADVQNKLFQPFTQADASTARKFGGTGLGLSISQRLVELMGGQISVRSALGEGSEFCIELALEVAPTWRMQVFGPSLQGLCVFAVIDNEEVRKIVRAYVLDAHAEITEFPSLDAVRTHMQDLPLRTDPAVVLLGLGARIADESLKLPAGLVQLVPYAKETVKHTNTVCHSPLMYGELIEAIAQASGRFGPGYMTHLAPMNVTQSQLHPNVEQALAKGQLILLAEDNEINRDVITEQLRRLGYACEVAFDGEQALAMWRSGRYALLLTDCHMPHMDGFELTKAIREAEPEGKRLPIVAITANAMQGEVQRCRERGMDDYLSKPTRMHALATMLHKWLPLATVRLQALTAGAEAMPDVAPAWDANTLSQMVGDNPAMHRRLLERFLVISETQVEAIVLSSDAGEFSDAADVAHAFKSASRMVGALALGDLCEQLETVSSVGDETACLRLTEDLVQALAQARLSITQHLESLPHEAP